MRTTGRSAALLLAALFAFTACGTTDGAELTGSGAAPAPSSPAARCAGPDQEVRVPAYDPDEGFVGDVPGDMPPHYAANHAFQQRIRLCGENLTAATAEATRMAEALQAVREPQAADVRRVLAELGHPAAETTVAESPDGVAFTVMVAPACLDGVVGTGGVVVRPLGIYSEGGCTKPVGGH